ncbi:MAG: hypothetical protein K6F79_01545 [Saccharofermentans sp.]|nr:hypothetical protein [Saccharofermentans sp.]
MVFQSGRKIAVFGRTEASGARGISCTIEDSNGHILCAEEDVTVNQDGSFLISLPPLSAGGPYSLKVTSTQEEETVILARIYIGEVWIAGGQSNMEYPLIRSEGARKTLEELGKTNIHFYKVPVAGILNEEQAQAEDSSEWIVADKDTCGDMSGVAFYFAQRVIESLSRDNTALHIGIIGCYLGGTSVSSWQSTETLMKTEEGRKYIEEFDRLIEGVTEEEYRRRKKAFDDECAPYNERLAELLAKDPYISYRDSEKILGPGAWPPPSGPSYERRPGALFDTMVMRIAPFQTRGVIFYQGETDAEGHEDDYCVVFKTMIEEWREAFRDNDLPFVFCELPMFTTSDPKTKDLTEMRWAKLRAQQQKVSDTVPGTFRVVLMDCCTEEDNIHPSDKRTPGERLANAALRSVYHKGV